MEKIETNQKSFIASFSQSSSARLVMVGILILILLIPLEFVKSLVSERTFRQKDVIKEINAKWGNEIFIYGPILKIPYTKYIENEIRDQKTGTVRIERQYGEEFAYFFPEQLINSSVVKTETKKRNNYESVVFSADMNFSGNFAKADFSSKGINSNDIKWEKATILVRTTNLSSIKNGVSIKFYDKMYDFEPIFDFSTNDIAYDEYGNETNLAVSSLETGFINLKEEFSSGNFNFSIKCDGSSKISFVPIGKVTQCKMESNWANPSFAGSFLPSEKQITNDGFSANWKILHINRPFSQQYFGELPNLNSHTFDVNFGIPVNEYQQNERAVKYGFLVIGLTFLIFFLIQTISKIRIHIFQYSMIGLALIVFYTLLISITEHSSFSLAYLISSVMIILLIGFYSISILKNKKFPIFIIASLSALYGFIYIIIQLENYALLVGSIGLFAILATVMYASRKIEW